MKTRHWRRILSAIAMCTVTALITACASTSYNDGGIVGTGNRTNCETQPKKDGAHAPVSPDCKP